MRGANAITMMGRRNPNEDARRRALVRLNGMMFYCLGIASFVESTAPLDTNRLIRLSEAHADVRPWLENVWLPGRAGHGRRFRAYIETTWPEFEWEGAYQEFREAYGSRSPARVGAPGRALEFVARCVTETTLAVFYRTLARCADDPELRELAGAAARDHAGVLRPFPEPVRTRRRPAARRSRHCLPHCHRFVPLRARGGCCGRISAPWPALAWRLDFPGVDLSGVPRAPLAHAEAPGRAGRLRAPAVPAVARCCAGEGREACSNRRAGRLAQGQRRRRGAGGVMRGG